MERPSVLMVAQFIIRDLSHKMSHLVQATDVNKNSSFLLGWCRLVYILFILNN